MPAGSSAKKHLKTLFLNQNEIRELLTIDDAIDCVEYAFRMHGLKKVQMPSKIYLDFRSFAGDLRVMPAYIPSLNAAGVKIVNSHVNNKRYRLPSVMAVFVLIDPVTGSPEAIMDATYLTDLRTGAAGAVATKFLARKDSSTLGLVGAGRQARLQLLAISRVLKIKAVKVCALTVSESKKFAMDMRRETGLEIIPSDIKDVSGSDVISTTTPVKKPIVMDRWIKTGAHINAIGADAPGKQELDVRTLRRARVFVDDMEQAVHTGEVNVGLTRGRMEIKAIAGEIGEVITGKKKGRLSSDDITIFDSTGLAIQDVSLAHRAYQRALKSNIGLKLALF